MVKQKETGHIAVNLIFRYMYLLMTFLISDAWLRVMTRWIGRYSIFAFAPNCFTLCWSLILTLIIASIRPRR